MAHIPDGVLTAPVLIGGALTTVAALTVALRRLDSERIPQVAVLSAAFFVSSLVSIPVGPGSVHLLLNGLMGAMLGWAAVPAILVALVLQAIFFGYGGLVVLGVNCINMVLPALICAALFGRRLRDVDSQNGFILGFLAGGLGVLLTGFMVASSIAFSNPDYLPAAKVMLFTYLPLMIVEAVVTGAAIGFARRVAPELLFLPER
ncbi:MAG: cobalt transporter CbiM [Candidatus Thiodiazotropha sp. (ex Semelilucina semeliformis)]|nr:cobalt transporter CbiM [Candidatus Thiodiazotropha sp. (ex Myrtea spinifera)]MCU7808784.1 cobalt transporter CbiM [Candidatus Thiodiazotropha sp. (ex Semelilucina semeliformis)]MCU7828854.1 cobalt transporter CbiM [Candidatus Thiodiazotropha sp. (ex Myrtea sp. 'scaly one' KF741663)]